MDAHFTDSSLDDDTTAPAEDNPVTRLPKKSYTCSIDGTRSNAILSPVYSPIDSEQRRKIKGAALRSTYGYKSL